MGIIGRHSRKKSLKGLGCPECGGTCKSKKKARPQEIRYAISRNYSTKRKAIPINQ
jgi:hypothetical protein